MNVKKVVFELEQRYPGKKIIKNDEENPTEIICEVEPTTDHQEYSLAVAVIDETKSHHHQKTKEVYKIIKGKLLLTIDGKEHVLNEGDSFEILPGQVHSAQGNETWIEAYSTPGWVVEDHLLDLTNRT